MVTDPRIPNKDQMNLIISGSVKFALSAIKEHWVLFLQLSIMSVIGFILLFFIFMFMSFFVLALLNMLPTDDSYVDSLVIIPCLIAPLLIISPGIKHVLFKIYDTKSTSWRDFFGGFNHFWRFAFEGLLYYCLVFIAFILFILLGQILIVIHPKLIFASIIFLGPLFLIPFRFSGYVILDQDVTLIQAFRISRTITHGLRLKLFFIYAGLLLVLNEPLSALAYAVPQSYSLVTNSIGMIAIMVAGGMMIFLLLTLPEVYIYRALMYQYTLNTN